MEDKLKGKLVIIKNAPEAMMKELVIVCIIHMHKVCVIVLL